ncbi:hypothetical protein GCM10010094_32650 [Streptomyces flaveus]|uniref:Uncharacterized protein n=1 Tax=Streptomyces flaveus TaxID=66370 RepID=A0A917QUN8_9ACTN|nr:hypothetical protein GCM10010094_32650 [Streptomyces flaveus]
MIYGVIVTIVGFTVSDADLDKAEGVDINLRTGLGMLALGVFFLVWLKLRPTPPPVDTEQLPPETDKGTERPGSHLMQGRSSLGWLRPCTAIRG